MQGTGIISQGCLPMQVTGAAFHPGYGGLASRAGYRGLRPMPGYRWIASYARYRGLPPMQGTGYCFPCWVQGTASHAVYGVASRARVWGITSHPGYRGLPPRQDTLVASHVGYGDILPWWVQGLHPMQGDCLVFYSIKATVLCTIFTGEQPQCEPGQMKFMCLPHLPLEADTCNIKPGTARIPTHTLPPSHTHT